MKKKSMLRWSLGLTAICFLFVLVTPVYNGDVDNYVMALVTNRLFIGEGQEIYINYLNPILCKIFTVVGMILPKAERPVRQSFIERASTTFCLAVAE